MSKVYKEGWVEILPSRIFKLPVIDDNNPFGVELKEHFINVSLLKNIISPRELVNYFPETVEGIIQEKNGKKAFFIVVITDKMEKLFVPIFALNFSKEQKRELILSKGIPERYFNCYLFKN